MGWDWIGLNLSMEELLSNSD